MNRPVGSIFGSCLLVMTAALAMPSRSVAYDSPCHTYAVEQARIIWSFPELDDEFANVSDGAGCEDSKEHIYYGDGNICGHTVRHFWDADDSDDMNQNDCVGYDYVNAWVKGRRLIDWAAQHYYAWLANPANLAHQDSAYHALGHACHLITDMGAPCHAKVDYHGGYGSGDACYEDWMAGKDDGQEPVCDENWDAEDAIARWGMTDLDQGKKLMIMSYLGDRCWDPKPLQASFYYLMYTTNQLTDYFASDSYDGDMDDRLGLVSFAGMPASPVLSIELWENDSDPDNDAGGRLTAIANHAYTRTMSASAAMFQAWRDYWDHERPSTGITITGAPEVHNEWRPGGVTVALAASDDSKGAAIHDSGVHEIQWKIEDADWKSINSAAVLFKVEEEGSNLVTYRSMDRFANLEMNQYKVIRIDMTPPEVAILSPDPGGHYLTTGSFTVDYEMSDALSGIYGHTATLDGEPVTDGQVFDDLSQMAGFHTLTVTAEDMAGNETTESVTFSIKIHATIEMSPEPINTRSHGAALQVDIVFPPEYDVGMVDVATTILTVRSQEFPALLKGATIGKIGKDGLPALRLKFDREPVCAVLAGGTAMETITVSGEQTDGVEFWGTDEVQVFSPPRDPQTEQPTTGVAPEHAVIAGVSPNPLASGTLIHFGLPRACDVEMALYDVSGRRVVVLGAGAYGAGYHALAWENDGSVQAGLYVLRMRAGAEVATAKMVVSR